MLETGRFCMICVSLSCLFSAPRAVARLVLDTPIRAGELPGETVTVTGSGAPIGDGIWVELWRIPAGGGPRESLASVRATGGSYAFEDVVVGAGDVLVPTLSRSWHFDTDGDAGGWDAEVSADALLQVSGGVLRVTITDGNGDGVRDPFFRGAFTYDPAHYRVVEIRLKNPALLPNSRMGLFFGAPWGTTVRQHNGTIPGSMSEFQTILFPMNIQELDIVPGPPVVGGSLNLRDGLWDPGSGALNDTLRIDPLENIPPNDARFDGTVFEIDFIRIREDYVFDFHVDGDPQGLTSTNDVADLEAAGGFLTYTAADVGPGSAPEPVMDGFVDPFFMTSLDVGLLDVGYFRRFVLGTDGASVAVDPNNFGIFFDDLDSQRYRDDCAMPDCSGQPLQELNLPLPAAGRQDVEMIMNGEWAEDGHVRSLTLRCDWPQAATEGDAVRLDYFGWTPLEPFGPGDGVVVRGFDEGVGPFIRGDTDGSGDLSITDPIFIFRFLFLGDPPPGCLATANTNGRDRPNITSGIYLLSFLFLGGPPPPPPHPQCGVSTDPLDLELGCEMSEGCP